MRVGMMNDVYVVDSFKSLLIWAPLAKCFLGLNLTSLGFPSTFHGKDVRPYPHRYAPGPYLCNVHHLFGSKYLLGWLLISLLHR